ADTDQVGAVDALERPRHHRPHAEQRWPFGGPVAAATGAEIPPAEHDERDVALGIAHSGFEHGDDLAFGKNFRPPAFAFASHAVAGAHVGKSPAHHDRVIAAAADVGVE